MGVNRCEYLSCRVLRTPILPRGQRGQLTPASHGPWPWGTHGAGGEGRAWGGWEVSRLEVLVKFSSSSLLCPTHAACQEDPHGTPSLGSRGAEAPFPSMP